MLLHWAGLGFKAMAKQTTSNWIYRGAGALPRYEVFLSDIVYAPHRHDSYTLALTLDGVQRFRYRGAQHHSLSGQVVVLHPDEIHDGQAGTELGFRYRACHLTPECIQAAGHSPTLPFLKAGVYQDPTLLKATQRLLWDLQTPLSDLAQHEAILAIAQSFSTLAGHQAKSKVVNVHAVQQAKDYIHAHLDTDITIGDLERISAHNRWQLARDFRQCLGTSPHRYVLYQRLQQACQALMAGKQQSQVAVACGFSDQSHFHRHFKQCYGLTPKQWLGLHQAENQPLHSLAS